MKRLIPIILALLVIGISPVVSLAGELEDAQEQVRRNPNDAGAHHYLGIAYAELGQHKEAIASYKEALSIYPNNTTVRNLLNNLEQKTAYGIENELPTE